MPEVDVAHQGSGSRGRHEVLDDDAVFEHRDLGVPRARMRRLDADPVAHHHDPFDGLAACQELGLGQHGWAAPSGVTPVPTPLPLGLQPSRAVDPLDLAARRAVPALVRATVLAGAWRPLVHHGVGRIVGRRTVFVVVARSGFTAPAPAAAATARFRGTVVGLIGVLVVGVVGVGFALGPRLVLVVVADLVGVGSALLTAPAATTPSAPTPPAVGRPIGLLVVLVGVGLVGLVGVGAVLVAVVVLVGLDRLGRDEQRHVLRQLGRRLDDRPGSGCPGDGNRCAAEAGNVRQRLGEDQVAYPQRILTVHAGMHSAGLPVEGGQRIQHLGCWCYPTPVPVGWTLRRSGSSSCRVGSCDRPVGGAPSTTYSPQAPGRVLSTRPREGFAMGPG